MAIKVAVAQMNSIAGNVEANLAKVAALMRSAAAQGFSFGTPGAGEVLASRRLDWPGRLPEGRLASTSLSA